MGCASHKFNLGVEEWLESDRELVAAVGSLAELMKQASFTKAAALLRDYTYEDLGKELSPRQQCVTRWTGTMDMIERYFKVKDQLERIKLLQHYYLTKEDDDTLKQARKAFTALKIVTKELQHKGITLQEVRELFDSVLKDNRFKTAFKRTIGPKSSLIKNPDFESAVLKLAADGNARLSDAEERAAHKLLIPADSDDSDSEEEDPQTLEELLIHLAKKRKLEEAKKKKQQAQAGLPATNSRYRDPSKFICATSNCCERLFSEAKYILVPHRSAMSPILFEALLFLKKNRRFWNLELVAQAMKIKPTSIQMERDDDLVYK